MEKIYRLEAWFTGRVQGVGFRYTVIDIAKGYEVCGSVKNLSDGRVYLIAEGGQGEVEDFLKHIQTEMASFIKEAEVTASMADRSAKEFKIAY